MQNAWGLVETLHNMGKGASVTVAEKTRSTAQNARMWSMLTEVADQLKWHGVKMTPEEWKHFFGAVLDGQKSVPNIEGTGFVVIGKSTSTMTISEMGDLMQLIEAFGAERGVRFAADEPEPAYRRIEKGITIDGELVAA